MIALNLLRAMLNAPETDDVVIAELEKQAVAFVEKQTGRHFGAAAQVTEYVDGTGTGRLWLQEEPAASPAPAVTEYAYVGATAVTITAANSDGFEIRGRCLHRKNSNVWTAGYEYKVVYTRGYAAGTEPEDVRQLVTDLVAVKYNARGSEGVASETVGPYSYTVSDADLDALPGARATLEAWRNWSIA